MRTRAVLTAFLLLACQPQVLSFKPQAPVAAPVVPPAPPLATLASVSGLSGDPTFAVVLVEDVCASNPCAYQLKGGANYADWTDCGVAFPPRANDAGSTDAQDPKCTPPTTSQPSLNFNLDLDTENELFVRTRDAEGRISTENFIIIDQLTTPPAAPASVKVQPSEQGVNVTWATVAGNTVGYRLYYGNTPPLSQSTPDNAFSTFLGTSAAQGPSPISISGASASQLFVDHLPDGAPVFVGVTAIDPLFQANSVPGTRGSHESAMVFADQFLQSATPSLLRLRYVSASAFGATRSPRAVAASDDLVVVAAVDTSNPGALSTVLLTYDLKALSVPGAKNVAPLGQLSVAETGATDCAFSVAGAPASIPAAPKSIKLFGRYAFVGSGTGDIFAFDLADPAHPKLAWQEVPPSPHGCGFGVDLIWPFLFIADGKLTNPTTHSALRVVQMSETAPGTLSASAAMCSGNFDSIFPDHDITAVSVLDHSETPTTMASGRYIAYVLSATKGPQRYIALLNDCSSSAVTTAISLSGNYETILGAPAAGATSMFFDLPLIAAAKTGGSFGLFGSLALYYYEEPYGLLPGGLVSDLSGAGTVGGSNFPAYEQTVVNLQKPGVAATATHDFAFAGEASGGGIEAVQLTSATSAATLGSFWMPGAVRDLALAGPDLVAVNDQAGLVVVTANDSGQLALRNQPQTPVSSLFAQSSSKRWHSYTNAIASSVNDDTLTTDGFLATGYPQPSDGTYHCETFGTSGHLGTCLVTLSLGASSALPLPATIAFANLFVTSGVEAAYVLGNIGGCAEPMGVLAIFGQRLYATMVTAAGGTQFQTSVMTGINLGPATFPPTGGNYILSPSLSCPTLPVTNNIVISSAPPTTGLAQANANNVVLVQAVADANGGHPQTMLMNVASDTAPVLAETFDCLRAPVLSTNEVCGILLTSQANAGRCDSTALAATNLATLQCFGLDGTPHASLFLGTTPSIDTGLAKRGMTAVAELVGDQLLVIDMSVTPPVVTRNIPLDTGFGEVVLDGPLVDVACAPRNVCDLSLSASGL